MKSTDKNLFACERQVITDAEMQEIDESLRPIETKAVEARQAVILNRIRIAATTFAVILIAFTLYQIWIGA